MNLKHDKLLCKLSFIFAFNSKLRPYSMGGLEEHFSELMPWLMMTLQSDGPMTQRSGAAQGLAECMAVLGSEHFEAWRGPPYTWLSTTFTFSAGEQQLSQHLREGEN